VDLVGLSALIALISLDKKHAFQLAFSQPLVLCTLIGLVTGDFETAIYFGLIVQLIWLGNLPVGASTTPAGNLASAVGCVLYIQLNESYLQFGQVLLLIVFIYTVMISFIGGQLDVVMRNFNIRLFDRALNDTHSAKKANIGKVVFSALAIQYVINFLLVIITMISGKLFLEFLLNYISTELIPILQNIDLAIIGVGIGMVISIYKGRKLKKIIVAISIFGLILFKII